MSAGPVHDPAASAFTIGTEIMLPNGEETISQSVVQPHRKASHSRQSSAPKRKRGPSGMDNIENVTDIAPIELNGQDKSKRQKLDLGPVPESRTGFIQTVHQSEYPMHPLAGEQPKFNDSYIPPWRDTTPVVQETLVPPVIVKEEQSQNSVKSAVPQDAKASADNAEHSFPTLPNFKQVFLENKMIQPWYFSPYPTGDIVTQAYNPNAQWVGGDYYPAGRSAKGYSKFSKAAGIGHVPPGSFNGPVNNGATPPRNHTRHDVPAHANAENLFVCERCFAYGDRPLDKETHKNECLQRVPGDLVYDDQPTSVDTGPGSAELVLDQFGTASSHLDGVYPPPSTEREGRTRIYEVDPVDSLLHKIFCKNITLFGKFFIDSKSIVFDCATFLYYVITVVEKGSETIAGFFTKEKESAEEYNLACIIVFPPYQRRGLGRLLIQFSYELSKHDGKIGSPEKPLSDLGMRSYAPIWISMVLDYLHEQIAIPYDMLLDRPKGNTKRQQRNPLGTSRTLKSKQLTASGSALQTDLTFVCTLEQIAAGAYLTASDASFALAELGLHHYIAGFEQMANADEKAAQDEATEASQAAIPPPPPSDPASGAVVNSQLAEMQTNSAPTSRDLSTTMSGPVPILTRDFVRLLGEKARARRDSINRDFVLL
ncbi:hypothetical protein M408DRAFT_327958 [Serendipita vermifera MAFF 305830]|uniref:MYST-type HAT domain-containing protein n=1 Tax=Serendipita vermifera MAFF 305830 TaxID=933852 RepID=A0A0C3B2L5_SERVB|nr:hypothetical protein M408DRAFT_327958 [Serendipita vermifera MAFF 305830]